MAITVALTASAEDNGLANMLATMMRQNLEDHPARATKLGAMRGRMAIFAEDAEVATTIVFDGPTVTFHDGIVGVPDLTIRGGFEQIGDLARMETGRFELPDPRGEVNRSLGRAMMRGALKVFGLPRGLPILIGFGDVMHVGG